MAGALLPAAGWPPRASRAAPHPPPPPSTPPPFPTPTLRSPPPQDEAPLLVDYREHHSDSNVHFVLQFAPGKLEEVMAAPGGLEARLKLTTKMATSE